MKTKYIVILTILLSLFGAFYYNISLSDSLISKGYTDRGYINGWYCNDSSNSKGDKNDSAFVQNRNYVCKYNGNLNDDPFNGHCIYNIVGSDNCTTRTSKKNGGDPNYFSKGILWDYESCVFNSSYLHNKLNIHSSDNDLDGIDGNPGCAYDMHQDPGEHGKGVDQTLEDYCEKNNGKKGNHDDIKSVLWEYTSYNSGPGVGGHYKDCEDYESAYCNGYRNGTIMWREYGCSNGICGDNFVTDTVAAGLGRPGDDNNNGVCDENDGRKCVLGNNGNALRKYWQGYCNGGLCEQRVSNTQGCNDVVDSRSDRYCDGKYVKKTRFIYHTHCGSPTYCIKNSSRYKQEFRTVDECNGSKTKCTTDSHGKKTCTIIYEQCDNGRCKRPQ